MLSIRADGVVVLAEWKDASGREPLLADVQVAEAADLADGVPLLGLLLEASVEQHLAEEVQQLLAREPVQPFALGL